MLNDMNANDDKLDSILARFEARTDLFDEMEIADAIQAVLRERGGRTAEPTFRELAEGIAFTVAETDTDKKSRWGTYYGPISAFQSKDGVEIETPSIDRITVEMIDYWEGRTKACQHPRLRIRYADLVWDLSRRVANRRPDVRYAQMTIDETMRLVGDGHCGRNSDAHCKLSRALNVALSLGANETPRAAAIRDATIAYEEANATQGELGTWGFAFDLLLEGQKNRLLTDDQERRLIDSLESRLAHAANSQPPDFNPFGAESAALRLARYYRRSDRHEDLRRVMNTYVQAWIKIAQDAMPMLGATWLEKVHRTLLAFGLRDQAEALEPQLRAVASRSHENMAKVSHTVKFTEEEIEGFVTEMTEGTWSETLSRIAIQFLPNDVKAREQVLRIAEQSPLMSLFSRRIVDRDGRVLAEVGSVQDDLDGHLVQHMAQNLTFWRPFLRLALERAHSRHNATVASYLEFLNQSPAFPSEHRPLIERGIRAFVEGDFAVAVHVLVPQIEAAVRFLVTAADGPVYELGRHGGFNLRNLDKLLSDPRFVNSLGERIALYLRVLLTDQRGWNIRNVVSHGLVGAAAFGPAVADRIVHAVLLLALVRETPPDGETSDAPDSIGPAENV